MVDDDGMPRRLPWEDWTDVDEVVPHTSAWVRATRPLGRGDYEGRRGVVGRARLRRAPEVGQSLGERGDTHEAAVILHPARRGHRRTPIDEEAAAASRAREGNTPDGDAHGEEHQ